MVWVAAVLDVVPMPVTTSDQVRSGASAAEPIWPMVSAMLPLYEPSPVRTAMPAASVGTTVRPCAAGTPAAIAKKSVPVAPAGVYPVSCTAFTCVASAVATRSYPAEASARAPPVPSAFAGARTLSVPAMLPPSSVTAEPDPPTHDRVTGEAAAPRSVSEPVTATAWADVPSTIAFPPMTTSTVPSPLSRTVAPDRDAICSVSTSRWSINSFVEPPPAAVVRMRSLSAATWVAAVLSCPTASPTSDRAEAHCASIAWDPVRSVLATCVAELSTTPPDAVSPGLFWRSDQADHIVSSWLDSPFAPGSFNDVSRSDSADERADAYPEADAEARTCVSSVMVASRAMPSTETPWPAVATVPVRSPVAATGGMDVCVIRCRVYPVVPAFAMF